MGVKAGLEGLLHVALAAETAQGDGHAVAQGRDRAELGDQLGAGESGQADVGDDDLGLLELGDLQRLFACGRGGNLATAPGK